MAGPVAEVASVRREAVRSHEREHVLLTLVVQLDWLLLAGLGVLVGYGLWALAGITHSDLATDPHYFLRHQATYAAIGVVGLLAVCALGPTILARYWRYLYGFTIFALLCVWQFGEDVRGARRWISVGSFQFQPSELAKPMLAIALAGFLAERGRRLREPQTALLAVALAAVPMGLVFVEPDLGTALVYCALLVGIIFISGTPWTQLAAGGVATVLAVLAVLWAVPALTGHNVLKGYQKDRLIHFWHPSKTADGPTYNVTQSKIAVASGGVRGRGQKDATQTRLNFLPAHRNDFAFAAFAEQHGFVGAATLLLLYLLVLWRGLRVITLATDVFSAMLVAGVLCMLLFQIGINVGMTMGIAPVTGIPLPLVSYGGSATIANLVALGLILSVQIRTGRRRTA
jgi:rod shape determining protein RodA